MSTIAIIFVCFLYLSFGSVFALGLTGTLKSIFGRRAAWAAIAIVLLWPFTPAFALWNELRDNTEDKY